ncbi:unnamed protein product [Effrenium voratum]|nr:unnamed protein product [Effrenium voratum]
MGLAASLEEKLRGGVLDSKLADIKQAKRLRDLELATRIASTRERLCWIGAYYGLVGVVSLARSATLRWQNVRLHWDNAFLPLNVVFLCMPPFVSGYQLDLAMHPISLMGYQVGGKANRIAEEAMRIRNGEAHHWFNCRYLPWVEDSTCVLQQPVCLPAVLEPAYHRERLMANRARHAKELPPEPEWAYFAKRCAE